MSHTRLANTRHTVEADISERTQDQDLFASTYMSIDNATDYAESTSSTMLYTLLSMLNLSSSDTLSHAASHIGVASSFVTLLRSLPFHASQRRMIIPADISSKNGVREEEVFQVGGAAEGIHDAVWDFATVANDHLLTARDMFKDGGVPSEAMPVFLHAVRLDQFSMLPRQGNVSILNCWSSRY